MGLLDRLQRLWERARRDATEAAAKEGARRTADAVGDRVRQAGDELLDDAEKQLDEARERREGREGVRPSSSGADAIEARIRAAAEAAERRRAGSADPGADPATDPDLDAREELARRKAALRRELYGEE